MSIRLEDNKQKFIEAWADMATHWGISKTMAQVHALLYSSDVPLDTDTIMEKLDISRGNANMTLRNLLSWGLIKKIDKSDSRKDLFEAEKDVWKITANIIFERSQREIKPIREAIVEILSNMGRPETFSEEEMKFYENINKLIEFLNLVNDFSNKILPLLHKKNFDKIDAFIKLLK
jgi:DNA-binding transcriptional regulator GbsR (MarR family)